MQKNGKEERRFLQGPQSRWKEFVFTMKVTVEFIRGFRKLHFVGPCVTIFGSARFKENHEYYSLARTLGSEVAKLGFTVMTGGGPGLMEAANRGAKDVGGRSVGCNIVLPTEQMANAYLDCWVDIKFFFVRKVLLAKYSYAFVVLPGGYGTLDEFFEALTLIQNNKTDLFPVVLMGKNYHSDLHAHILKMYEQKTISKEDMDIFLFTDDIQEAISHIKVNAIERFNLITPEITAVSALGEKKL